MRVGWIGLGAMGAPMAALVARAGLPVTAFDVLPDRARELAADGVAAAPDCGAAADGADVLAVMVATPAQLDSVLDAAAGALAPGCVVLVMSTVGPAAVRNWSATLAERDVGLVDAPVSGGTQRAADGDLLIMVSGAPNHVDTVRPLLDVLARNAPVVGAEPGAGQRVKLVNQLLCGLHIAASAEALAFAEAIGLDARACREVIRHGAAASFMLDDRGERMVDPAGGEVRSALNIFVKDMGLVLAAARESAFPAPLTAAAEQLYLAGQRAGLGHRDDSQIISVLRGDAPLPTHRPTPHLS